MQNNPFIYGKRVPPNRFIDRKAALRTLVSRTLNGESTAIVGRRRIGKTSLLHYLEQASDTLFGNAKQIIFSSLDAYMLGSHFTQTQFWQEVLRPLLDWAEEHPTEPTSAELMAHYKVCQEKDFNFFELEEFLKRLDANQLYFVLMIDEFEVFVPDSAATRTGDHFLSKLLRLFRPTGAIGAQFFGSLRGLLSRNDHFVVITASRLQLSELHVRMEARGSPFFNHFSEVKLGNFSDKEVDTLLTQGAKWANLPASPFSAIDHKYIHRVAGGHPYLLQATAASVWDAIDEGLTGERRYQRVGELLHERVSSYWSDTWKEWTLEERKLFIVVALPHIPRLLSHVFPVILISYNQPNVLLNNLGGLLTQSRFGPRITSGIMVWWLADELVRAGRSDRSFEQWLRQHKLDRSLTEQQQELLQQVATDIQRVQEQVGVASPIEAFAIATAKAVME